MARLRELAFLFLKLGTIGFGGPAAHVALMEDEVVRRRGWLNLEPSSISSDLPISSTGPNSPEMAIHIRATAGRHMGNLIVAGACFILPSMLLIMGCAWAYVKFGGLPQAAALLYGVKPVIIAVVLRALWGLGKSAIKSVPLAMIGMGAAVGSLLGIHELLLLLGGAAMALPCRSRVRRSSGGAAILGMLSFSQVRSLAGTVVRPGPTAVAVSRRRGAACPLGCGLCSLFFLKVGSVLFGSGYVAAPRFCGRTWWSGSTQLSETQLLDAIAAGQITPDPWRCLPGDLHRLSPRRRSGVAHRDARDLPARVRLRRLQRAAVAETARVSRRQARCSTRS